MTENILSSIQGIFTKINYVLIINQVIIILKDLIKFILIFFLYKIKYFESSLLIGVRKPISYTG